MKYKAIIFDLDGTVVPSEIDGMPSQAVIDAVHKAKKYLKLSTASGRSVNTCRNIWKALSIEDPCVISGGSQIINPVNEEIIWEQQLPKGAILKILEICEGYTDQFAINGVFLNFKNDKFPEVATIVVALGIKKEKSDELIDALLKISDIAVHTLPSWIDLENCWDIHITHKLATKKHSIEKLIEILGVRKEEVIGIGDGNNDMPLFESVGYKVAMGNAVDSLKESADYITDTLDNDGFAKFIEAKILDGN